MVSAALLTGSLATFASTNSNTNLFDYSSMGSGSEIRTEILDMNAPNILNNEANYKFGEGKCGEGEKKEGEAKKATTEKAVEGKAVEGKAEEAKCGEGEKKGAEAKKAVTKEGKAAEAKCG